MSLKASLAKIGNKNPIFGKKHTKETKIKMSFKSKGRKVNKEWRKKISNTLLGRFKGKRSPHWKGGKLIRSGYVFIYQPNHPFCNNFGYIREHRLILENYLKRHLKPKEQSHHINGIKNDNRLENLILFVNNSAHQRFEWNKIVKLKEIIFDGRKLNG